jgi:photosystem II stability/assembly factor-like uncharacterized protein
MRKFISALVLIGYYGAILQAQQIDLSKAFKNLKPRNIGPAGMSGRITAIDAVWTDPEIIYIASASGGLWKTENGGASWKAVFDEQPIQNIGSVAITQSNPSVVWVGTGEGNPRNSVSLGDGIYKSLDGGKNWKCMGLQKTKNIHRIIIDPSNPDIIYAGAIGNPYAENSDRGLYKSIDGGENWKLILHTNDTSGVGDMVMDPVNPGKLLVAMWQHRRTPWSFKSGGVGSGLYLSYDGGKTFKKLSKEDGLPDSVYGRIGLTICKSDPERIYALIEAKKNGLYKSSDGGVKWELVNSDPAVVTNRAFYFQDIRSDPNNENRLYNINQMISESEDGGKTFKTIIPYSGIHPDHHAFWINPINPNFILDGNDGGLAVSHDRGRTWQFDEKLPVGQFYHINVDNSLPYNVMGGLQDNGSWQGPAYVWINSGLRNSYWNEVGGGDGFDVMADPENPDWVYSMSQGGELGRYNIATGEQWEIRPPDPSIKLRHRFNWNAAIAQDPLDKSTIYYGSQFLNKSVNKGTTWEIISPDLTTNDSIKTDQSKNGGLSIDITGAENYCTILSIEPSSKQKGVIWVGTDDGNVQLTKDGGKTWLNFRGKIPGMPVGCWIPQIRASKYNAGEVFVVCNDYRRGDFRPYIFRSTDFGNTWTRLVDDQKVKGYALTLIQDPVEPNLIFVGTEQGLWMSFDNGKKFQQFKNGYPSVSTYDFAIQEREADLVIATFGRALWILDDIRPLRKLAAGQGLLPPKKMIAFDAPQAYEARLKNPIGIEYSIWGTYEGENRKAGAELSFYLDKTKLDTGKSKIPDSGYVKIYADAKTPIRSIKIKADTGFNRVFWGMEEKGIRNFGSRAGRRVANTEEEPAGLPVDPGTYKAVIEVGKEKDSLFVTVHDDPRAPLAQEIRAARRSFNNRINEISLKVLTLSDRLNEAEETITKINDNLKSVDSLRADSLKKSGAFLLDSIKAIRYLITGKPQELQGYGNIPQLTVAGIISVVKRNVINKNAVPGPQEEKLYKDGADFINDVLKKGNDFFEGRWKTYRNYYEATPVKLFKDYKPID